MGVSKVILNGTTLIDVTQKTVTAGAMLSGTTALKNDGTDITGSIASKTSSNLSVSGNTVTAPAGYYASNASASVASGTEGTPTATKGTVSSNSISVTPSVTNSAGYISGGTHTGNAVSVSASELVSGTLEISSNGEGIDVTNYASVDVDVDPNVASLTVTPTESQQTFSGGTSTGSQIQQFSWRSHGQKNFTNALTVGETYHAKVEKSTNDGWTYITEYDDNFVCSSSAVALTTYVSVTNTYVNMTSDDYDFVRVTVYDVVSIDGYLPVTVNAISSSYIGSGITRRSSSDLGVSGDTVSVPAGYYESAASASVGAGSVTAPSTISGSGASVTAGTNTLTLSKTVSVTPSVTTAGYITSGTAGNSDVSLSASVTTKAATTYYPSTSDQSISASQYLTGAQTIKAVEYSSNLIASNIADGVTVTIGDTDDADRILSVTGTLQATPNLTTKSVEPNGYIHYVTVDTELCSISLYTQAQNRTAGSDISFTGTMNPTGALTDGNSYRVLGRMNVIDSYGNVIEYYDIDSPFVFSSTQQYIVQNDANAYYASVKLYKSLQNVQFTVKCQKTAAYGHDIYMYACEAGSYDGLSMVTIGPEKYPETFMSAYLTRNTAVFTNIVWPSGITTIGKYSFAGCGYFNTPSIPNTVQTIGDYAFYGCLRLALTSLPASITTINQYAFWGCSALALTSLPSSITAINPYVFYGCKNLAISSIPSGVTKIDSYAFYGCEKITVSSLPVGCTILGSSAFNGCTSIQSMTLPTGLTAIQSNTFQSCYNLSTITIPDTVTSINNQAFAYCEKLESIECNGVLTLVYGIYGNATHPMTLRSVKFPNATSNTNITGFGRTTAAEACQLLEEIDIGSMGLGSNAFANCYSLQTLVLRKSTVVPLTNVSYLLNTPFRGYNGLTGTVYVPSALIASYRAASNWSTLYTDGTCNFVAIEGSDWDLS